MKRNKKVIGLIVTFALVVSALFTTRVESKADTAPSGFPTVGEKIVCETNISSDITAGMAELEVANITAHVISSEKWDQLLIVYFYEFKPNLDAGFAGGHSYVIYKGSDHYNLERNQATGVSDDAVLINNYLNSIKTDSQNGSGSIQEKINNGYSMQWKISEPVLTSTSEPSPHTHNWEHGVIYEATETEEGLEGDYCTDPDCGATRNTSPISCVYTVMDNRMQQIEWASPANPSILEMTTLCSLPNYFMKMIDAKKNCDFTMRFTYNKKHYEVYIPAGTQFNNSLDWYGPEQLLAMFEYKELY